MSLKPSSVAALTEPILVPGSVANLGGGFDTLGVAVELFLRVRLVDVADDGGTRLRVTRSTPPIRGTNALERAFALIARRTGTRTPTVSVEVESDIPMAAGLGSSAAATVAGLRVFERVSGAVPEELLLAIATEAEGHADNAAPALFGGLVSVVEGAGGPAALRWTWPEGLKLVVATPVAGLSTSKARAAVPGMVALSDAVFNLQRVLSLVHALQSGDDARLREAVRDRLHQAARAPLVPLLDEALALDDPDVLGVFLSGAGPSIAALARHSGRVEDIMRALYAQRGVEAVVRTLPVYQGTKRFADALAPAHGGVA